MTLNTYQLGTNNAQDRLRSRSVAYLKRLPPCEYSPGRPFRSRLLDNNQIIVVIIVIQHNLPSNLSSSRQRLA